MPAPRAIPARQRLAPRWWAAGVAIAILYCVFLFPSPDFNLYNKDDASLFLTLGINLVEQLRYTTDTFPSSQEAYGRHGAWPVVFPALLALVVYGFGTSWYALKFTMVILGLSNLALLSRLWRDRPAARWAVLLTALNPAYFLFSHVTMSEIPFMLTCTLTLLALKRATSPAAASVAGGIAAVTFLTRGYGISFLPAGILYFLIRPERLPMRLRMAVSFSVPLLLAIIGWNFFAAWHTTGVPLDFVTARFGEGASSMLSLLSRGWIPYVQEFFWYHGRYPLHLFVPLLSWPDGLASNALAVVSTGSLLVAAYGWWLSVRRGPGPVEVWLPFGIGLLLIGLPNPRQWVTYLPFILFYWVIVLDHLAMAAPMRVARRYAIAVLVLVTAFGLGRHLAAPDGLRFHNREWREYRDIAAWASGALPTNAIVVAPVAHNFRVASNRRTYRLESVQADAWPPVDLLDVPDLYLFCPDDSRDPVLQRVKGACASLIGSGRFDAVRAGDTLTLYRYRPSSTGYSKESNDTRYNPPDEDVKTVRPAAGHSNLSSSLR